MPVCRFVATRTKLPQPSLWKLWSSIGGLEQTRRYRYRPAAVSVGVDGLDVLAAFILAAVWDGNPDAINTGTILFAVLLMLLPLGLGVWLTHTCTAWNGTREGRCARACYGLRRCGTPEHSRSAQPLTLPEGVALLSWGVAVLNIWIFLSAAL